MNTRNQAVNWSASMITRDIVRKQPRTLFTKTEKLDDTTKGNMIFQFEN